MNKLTEVFNKTWGMCALLAVVTLAVYWPVHGFDFINFDDPLFFKNNHDVLRGMTWEGVKWAFRPGHGDYWHPVVWLSHMLDAELFGRGPAGPHVVNVLFHAANSVLVFVLLKRLTGAHWRSAAVAALFAQHPMRVESVVWISERKDVLSTLFLLLTLLCYARYTQRPTASPDSKTAPPKLRGSFGFYWLALVCFALGMMTKPMLVTLPCVMLLLDFWPLRRFDIPDWNLGRFWNRQQSTALKWLLIEKIPFFLLSGATCVTTFLTAKSSVADIEALSLGSRVETAVVAYGWYLLKVIWPVGLAPIYPHPARWPFEWVTLSGLVLLALTVWAVKSPTRRPYALVGWFWYLGTLVPVIGLVQVGSQWVADRFVYVPYIGVFIALVWAAGAWFTTRRISPAAVGGISAIVLLALAARTRDQLALWKDTETLFGHAVKATRNNFIAHDIVGHAAVERGAADLAEFHYVEALRIRPRYACSLGNLGELRAQQGKLGEARRLFETAIECDPKLAQARSGLGFVLVTQGHIDEGIAQYREAIQLKPDLYETLNNLAWLLATHPDAQYRNGPEAVQLAERACELTWNEAAFTVGTLAAAYAEAGRFRDAIATAERARDLAQATGQSLLVERNTALLEVYRAGRPYRDEQALHIERVDVKQRSESAPR